MKISKICGIGVGYTARGRLQPADVGGVSVLQLRDLSLDRPVDPAHLERVHLDGFQSQHLVKTGDVVFRSRGEHNTAFALGAKFHEPAVALLPLFILRPRTESVLPEYLAWAINQSSAQRYFDSVAQGTNMRMVSRTDIDNLDISLPNLDTQQKIVNVDALAKHEQILMVRLADKRKKLLALILRDQARHHSRSTNPEIEK